MNRICRTWSTAVLAMVVSAAAACASPTIAESPTSNSGGAAVSVENCGRTVSVPGPPTKAVTLNQSATEIMLTLGLEDQLAGTAYLDDVVLPDLQAAYDEVPVLSDKYPSKEAFLSAEPDFAYAGFSSAYDDQALGTRADLEASGIPAYVSPAACEDKALRPNPVTFDVIYQEIADIAEIFGVQDKGDHVIADMKAKAADVAQAAPGAGRTALWWDSDTDAPYVGAGAGMPAHLLSQVGLANVFGELDGSWASVNWENVVLANPDVIVLVDASWDPAADKIAFLESNPATRDLSAVQGKQYVIVPFSQTTVGVRNVQGAVDIAAQLTALG